MPAKNPTPTAAPDSSPIEHSSLAAALSAFQGECPPIRKGNRATVPTKSGGQYSYDYADLSDVLEVVAPVLARHGLSFNGKPTVTKRGFGLKYRLRHLAGESDKGFYPLPDPRGLDPQEQGKWQTYVRRYVLCSVLGVAPGGDDDDAATSSGDAWTPRQAPPARQRRQQAAQRPHQAAPAQEAPKPDPAWLERAEAATTKEDADVVWAELRAAVQEGQATIATTDAVAALWRARKAAQATEAPAAEEAAAPAEEADK